MGHAPHGKLIDQGSEDLEIEVLNVADHSIIEFFSYEVIPQDAERALTAHDVLAVKDHLMRRKLEESRFDRIQPLGCCDCGVALAHDDASKAEESVTFVSGVVKIIVADFIKE